MYNMFVAENLVGVQKNAWYLGIYITLEKIKNNNDDDDLFENKRVKL